jgi:hypothetical protein
MAASSTTSSTFPYTRTTTSNATAPSSTTSTTSPTASITIRLLWLQHRLLHYIYDSFDYIFDYFENIYHGFNYILDYLNCTFICYGYSSTTLYLWLSWLHIRLLQPYLRLLRLYLPTSTIPPTTTIKVWLHCNFDYFDCSPTASHLSLTITTMSSTASVVPLPSTTTTSTTLYPWLLRLHLRQPQLHFHLLWLHHGLLLLYHRLVWLHFRYVDYISDYLSYASDYCIIHFQLPTNIHIHPSSPSLKPT